jgi:hypothetical protein
MRKLLAISMCVAGLGLLASCSDGGGTDGTADAGAEAPADVGTDDIRVDTIRDITFNVEGFDTYAWVGAAAAVRDPDREWTPSGLDVASELKFLVDRELRERGRSQVVQDPKMVAIFAIGLDMKAVEVSINPESDTKEFEPSPKAGVFVYLIHPRTRYVVWAGRAIGDVTENITIEQAKERLEHAVDQMFEDFPD